ncbi:TetR/AcrR family transcriptional regulator [Silvibacterium dinghuense]|uniref:TetR/AcrR family transcriptional regulator n=1 Tax=Silvibacterium dinghuense TaxID=1560006 RepID=UPI0013E99B7E|nr:TetR/AcrR family transcriptional regulator [Silvibacterium dinghuense]
MNTVKIQAERKPGKRSTYHHGDLRTALIQAADAIIAEGGIEAFSLRAAAQRAGVSPGAPAHHFGNARGLLTEVALLAYKRLEDYIQKAGHSDDPVAEVRALSLAFIHFALDHPGHFRLMFRNDLVDRSDPRFASFPRQSGRRLSQAILTYQGKNDVDMNRFEDAADILCGMATLHGLASLVLEEKAVHFFRNANARDFRKKELPRVIEHLYPERRNSTTRKKAVHGKS